MIQIVPYQNIYKEQIIELILFIQQKEFNVPITLADQPDLQIIPAFYQQNEGNFWVALSGNEVVGTIALIDCGDEIGGIRKMFVKTAYRGKEYGVSSLLLQTLMQQAEKANIKSLYLGTVERLQAAMRFYEKNGFSRIEKILLPPQFPIMTVDTVFYEYKF